MALRATNAITSDAYISIKRTASQLKINVDAWIPELASNGADYGFIQGIYLNLVNADNAIDEKKTTPGLATYANEQEDDPGYDFQAETQTTLAAITDAFTWVDTHIPITGRTLKQISDWDGASTIVADTFTPAQTSGLQALLQTVTDSIV
ncbi:MAG: hypothetical protein DRI46_10185 [Chloroflexi bacterium]|nr:MAG: hypothetical protein DRI46_10185 [Chloroflexota bacterium]